MRFVKYTSLIFGILFPLFLCGQSPVKLTGTVVDSSTNQPVEDASVTVLDGKGGTYTDADGQFQIAHLYSGTYRLRIAHIRYQPKNITITLSKDVPEDVTIHLAPRTFRFPAVTVEGEYYGAQEIFLSRERIERFGNSAAEVLEQVPQITITREGDSGARGIRIRGSNTNQVLVLVDGIPLNDPLTGEVNLETISTEMIQEIRIHPHGASAEYGSGAYAGVVRIITRNQPVEQWSVGGAVESYSGREVSTFLSGEIISPLYYNVSYSGRSVKNDYRYSYNLPDGTSVTRHRENAAIHLRSLQSSLSYTKPSRQIRISGHLMQSDRGLPGKIYQWTPYANAHNDRAGISGSYREQFSNGSLDIQSQLSTASSEYVNDPPADAPLQYRLVPPYDTRYDHGTLGTSADLNIHLRQNIHWNTGVDLEKTEFQQTGESLDYADPIRATQESYGLHSGAEFSTVLGDSNYSITTNPQIRYSFIRYNNGEEIEQYPFWSASLGTSIRQRGYPNGTLFSNLNRSFRIPTFGDLFYQDFRVSGNPDLRPEQSREATIGLKLRPVRGRDLEVTGEAFWREFRDQIIWVTGSYGNFSPTNTDSRITGQSFSVTWNSPDDRFFGRAGFEHLVARNKNPNHALLNKTLPFRPAYEWRARFGSNLKFLTIIYDHRFRGSRFITQANTKSLPPYELGSIELRGVLSQRLLPEALSLQIILRINNLWDNRYYIMERMPEPGRNYRLSLELNFNHSQ
ncbi:MAG: TonB-dependent receptor [Candidatus Marinimicrobia bacterium]|nr:TonB-dependent receptor [Candidatus Neomarinimicrobiota bacterium]MCF7827339.1 TonB-dependent receptor [Candidatus Neomarinimicrobiota bacterium]MCF7881428.1 TonB-dependent receptor [Candidatus Neomarinimicrobiota bacterium]